MSNSFLEKARLSPSFEREYNLAYLGGVGNVFHVGDIDAAFSEPYSLDPSIRLQCIKSISLLQDLLS